MLAANLGIPKYAFRARAWLEWGKTIHAPIVGCVVIYARKGGGHVGFVVGQDQHGNLMTLGGNQGDAVTVAPFDRSRVLGYRWPDSEPMPPLSFLPVVDSNGNVSTNEA
jgi:uncharacterized protein (TIGR02594 family)